MNSAKVFNEIKCHIVSTYKSLTLDDFSYVITKNAFTGYFNFKVLKYFIGNPELIMNSI